MSSLLLEVDNRSPQHQLEVCWAWGAITFDGHYQDSTIANDQLSLTEMDWMLHKTVVSSVLVIHYKIAFNFRVKVTSFLRLEGYLLTKKCSDT